MKVGISNVQIGDIISLDNGYDKQVIRTELKEARNTCK